MHGRKQDNGNQIYLSLQTSLYFICLSIYIYVYMNDDLIVCNDGKPMTILIYVCLSFYVMVDLVQPGLKTKVTLKTKKNCRLWLT